MKTIVPRLEHFFLTQSVWLFFTVLITVNSLVLFRLPMPLENWDNYFYILLSLVLIFSPILLLSGFRDWWREKLSKRTYALLWIYTFIVYPTLLVLARVYWWEQLLFFPNAPELNSVFESALLGGTGLLLLLTELAYLSTQLWQGSQVLKSWIRKIPLEKAILLLILFLSFVGVLADTFFRQEVVELSGIAWGFRLLNYTAQYFLISFIYYLFYWVNHYFLISKLLKQKGIFYYLFGFALTIFLAYPFSAQLIYWLPVTHALQVHPVITDGVFGEVNWFTPMMGMLASIPFILTIQWFKQSGEIAHLEKEKIATELSLLKQRINPHFFFNTLNNLYALSLTQDKATPDVVLQLSELMRYVIYKGKEDTVTLAEEVKHLEDYIELQRIRLHKQFQFSFTKAIEDDQIRIPPLLFTVLVENAFKHGIEPAEKDCFLHLHLKSDQNQLSLTCENSVEEQPHEEAGIGLNTLRRRLALRFPDRHEFRVEQKSTSFKTSLILAL